MIAIRQTLRRWLTDQKGATAIEYGIIVALVAIALMGGLSKLGGGTNGMWTMIKSQAQAHM